jgi:N-dimethylarginine dimethylaminohydrolase
VLAVHQDTQFDPNELCSPEEIEEYLRLDTAFRTVCASYALMCDALADKDGISERDKRLILNLSADLQHKARCLMKLSSGLRRDAESHLLMLRKEVAR